MAVPAAISWMDDIGTNSISVTSSGPGRVGGARGVHWEVRGREVSHGGPLQAREEPPSPSIWSNASVWSFADGCAVSRHQRNAGLQQHLLYPQLYWRATAPVRENTQSHALAPADTSNLNSSFIQANNTPRDHPRTLITYLRPADSEECTTATLLSSACHQGCSITTVMEHEDHVHDGIKTNQTPSKSAAIHTDVHVVT